MGSLNLNLGAKLWPTVLLLSQAMEVTSYLALQ